MTNNNSTFHCEKFQMEFLPSVYGVEFCLALSGNVFALWLFVSRDRRNWHTGIVLSCNLAISDLLYALTLPLLIVYYLEKKRWTFGDPMCRIERFLFTCNLYVSVFFIMAISVNRCVAIAYPFFARNHVRPAHVKALSAAIWVLVAAISCPVLGFASTCPAPYDPGVTQCVSYCEQTHHDESAHFSYKVFLATFGCLVPFLVTFASYAVVFRVVWKNANITASEKRKVGLMTGAVVVLYAVSFLPYHVFQTWHLHLRLVEEGAKSECWVYQAYQVSKGLATINMCLHPLIYMAVLGSIKVACCGKNTEDSGRREVRA